MIYEPIIKAHQKKFKEAYNLINDSEDQIFEKFVNYSELLQHQPDVFSSDLEFLDLVCVGGGQDGGLDGIAIKVNGYFIKSQEEIDEVQAIIERASKIETNAKIKALKQAIETAFANKTASLTVDDIFHSHAIARELVGIFIEKILVDDETDDIEVIFKN